MELTPEQCLSIDSPGPIACIAGAGSGKTSVLARRYLKTIDDGVSAHRILAITFTTDAAAELKERILTLARRKELKAEVLSSIVHTPNIGTIHSLCYRVLDSEASQLGLPPISGILLQTHWLAVLAEEERLWRQRLTDDELDTLDSRFGLSHIRELVGELYARPVFELPPGEEGTHLAWLKTTLKPLVDALEARLRRKGLYSFDDLERLTQCLLDNPQVRDRIGRQFDAILVDEYQDTNSRQFEIVQRLVEGRLNRLFIVGDPKQSIYRFRQAEVGLFFKTIQLIEEAGGSRIVLSFNFRADSSLLDRLGPIAARLFPEMPPMTAGRPSPVGDAQLTRLPLSIVRYPQLGTTDTTWAGEFDAVVMRVQSLLASGAKPSSIAVLFRQGERMRALQGKLQNNGVPVTSYRATYLFDSYAVKDLASFLRAVLNPLDDHALSAFLRSSFVNYSLSDLWLLQSPSASGTSGTSLFEKLNQKGEPRWFFSLIESGTWELDRTLATLFENTGTIANYASATAFLKSVFEMTNHVATAVELVDQWQRGDLMYSLDQTELEAVKLATVHSVKGLEFDHVFLADCLRTSPKRHPALRWDESGVPALRIRHDGEWTESERYQALATRDEELDLEESKRVLYVALTRARETLTLFLPADGAKIPSRSWAQLLSET